MKDKTKLIKDMEAREYSTSRVIYFKMAIATRCALLSGCTSSLPLDSVYWIAENAR